VQATSGELETKWQTNITQTHNGNFHN
jgi:hypothetical protein